MFPKQARISSAAVRVAAGDANAQLQFVMVELDARGSQKQVWRSAGRPADQSGVIIEFPLTGFSIHPGRVYLIGVQVHGGTNGVAVVGSAEHDPYISWDVPDGFLSASNNKFPGYRELASQGSDPGSPTIGSLEPATIAPLVALKFSAPTA